jgi:hypothetical protein
MVLRWLGLGMPAIALWVMGTASPAADGALDFGWQPPGPPSTASTPAPPRLDKGQLAPTDAVAQPASTPAARVAGLADPKELDRPGAIAVDPNLVFSPPVILSPGSRDGRRPAPKDDLPSNVSPPMAPAVTVSASPIPAKDGGPVPDGERPRESGSSRPLAVPTTPLPAADASEAPAIAPPPVSAAPVSAAPLPVALEALFAGEADSVVARVVGSAEGTRTPTGGYTTAYFGHRDPGNGAWNLGSFSYQHGAASPEQADRRQWQRLQAQAQILTQQAQDQGLTLTRLEWLNALDLANQAPAAALDRGYIPWLAQARQLHMPEAEAILWARTRAFLDPDTGRWNAPGLGNTVQAISADQARRQRAIAATVDHLNATGWPLPTGSPPF